MTLCLIALAISMTFNGLAIASYRKRLRAEKSAVLIRFVRPIEPKEIPRFTDTFRELIRVQFRGMPATLLVAGRWIPIWPCPPALKDSAKR